MIYKRILQCSSNWSRRLNVLLIVALMLPLMAVTPAQAPGLAGHVQPLLLQMAAEQPDQTVAVIVQKAVKDTRIEDRVAALGGTVTKDLHIINALAVEMRAKDVPQLAQAEGVRWVSFDAPAVSSAIEQAAPLNAAAVTLSLSPVKDTCITAVGTSGSTTNIGACSSLGLANTLGSPAIYRRPLLMFDLSAIPAGATILSASMDLYASYVDHSGTVNAHRVTSDWDEGTASCATNGSANWTNRKAGPVAWTTPGGDYDPAVAASVAVSAVGAYHFDLTALAQNWVNSTYANYGVLLEQPTQAGYGEISWQSKETFTLAQAPKLQVVYTTDTTYVTWATQLGTVAATTFSNSSAMVDSALGANGAYGSGAWVTGSFAGFAAEVTPGNAISKVELVLHGYAATSLTKSVIFSTYIRGTLASQVTAPGSIFNNVVGSSKAGPVYIDLTGTRAWQWADLDNDLQVVISQSAVDQGNAMHYDAIGLRVTSRAGTDASRSAWGTTTLVNPAIDPSRQVNIYNSVIGASRLWNSDAKLRGKGIAVAVVDSGVYATGDLGSNLRGKRVISINFNRSYHSATDRYGHGTFVAGVVGGDGNKSGGRHIGVAPESRIMNIRVSDDQGMSYESDVVAGLQWVLDHKAMYNIRVVNLSLNSAVAQSYHTSPLDAAVEILWFNGIVVVVSAGNNGTATLFPPANDPFVITVGATDDKGTADLADDVVASFSAYGVTESGTADLANNAVASFSAYGVKKSGTAKPELVTPGRNVIAFMPDNKELTISAQHPSNRVDDNYFRMSGTSVSAPMVSGAVALLLQDEPNLNPDQVKYRLMATANKTWPGYDATKAGAGYLDIYAAVNGTTTQSANTGIYVSHLLDTGNPPVSQLWGSAQWGSAQWGSAQWGSAQWGSAQWGSAQWGSDYWGP